MGVLGDFHYPFLSPRTTNLPQTRAAQTDIKCVRLVSFAAENPPPIVLFVVIASLLHQTNLSWRIPPVTTAYLALVPP